jgi:hypothetical protein
VMASLLKYNPVCIVSSVLAGLQDFTCQWTRKENFYFDESVSFQPKVFSQLSMHDCFSEALNQDSCYVM